METLIINIRDVIEPFISDLHPQIGNAVTVLLGLPPVVMTLYFVALFFICAVVILFIRDTFRYILITIIHSYVAVQDIRVRIMNNGGAKKILIVGDSTAVGSGAKDQKNTLMGMFAHDFPDMEIHNIGMNAALTKHVILQLKKVERERFTLAIVSTGGNDVWRFTPLQKLAQDLNVVLQMAIAVSDNVVLLINNNIGLAHVFPIFISDIIALRSKKINQLFRKIADHYHIQHVDIFTETETNPFIEQPKILFSRDGIHPNAEGYRLWYNRLWRVLSDRNYGLREQAPQEIPSEKTTTIDGLTSNNP